MQAAGWMNTKWDSVLYMKGSAVDWVSIKQPTYRNFIVIQRKETFHNKFGTQ